MRVRKHPGLDWNTSHGWKCPWQYTVFVAINRAGDELTSCEKNLILVSTNTNGNNPKSPQDKWFCCHKPGWTWPDFQLTILGFSLYKHSWKCPKVSVVTRYHSKLTVKETKVLWIEQTYICWHLFWWLFKICAPELRTQRNLSPPEFFLHRESFVRHVCFSVSSDWCGGTNEPAGLRFCAAAEYFAEIETSTLMRTEPRSHQSLASDSIRTAARWHHNNETNCLRSDLLLETVQTLEMVLSLRVTSGLLIWGPSFEKLETEYFLDIWGADNQTCWRIFGQRVTETTVQEVIKYNNV